MDMVPATYVVTLPNVDPGGSAVGVIMRSAADRPGRIVVAALGETRYWGVLRVADAMLGNSSSGIIEAPAVGLPVINVGDRQAGRLRAGNVIDVVDDPVAIADTLRAVLAPGAREALRIEPPALADGRAGERVARIIEAWHPSRPPRKAPIVLPS
jgi:UDP-N-acetylglucosamine 2-epimerase